MSERVNESGPTFARLTARSIRGSWSGDRVRARPGPGRGIVATLNGRPCGVARSLRELGHKIAASLFDRAVFSSVSSR